MDQEESHILNQHSLDSYSSGFSAEFTKRQVKQGGIITKEMRLKHQQLDHKQVYAEIQTSPLFSDIKNVTNEKLSC